MHNENHHQQGHGAGDNSQHGHNQPQFTPPPPSVHGPAQSSPQVNTQPSPSPAAFTMNASVGADSEFSNSKESVPVVKVWSVRGVEYAIMSFMLWFLAIAVNWVLVALVTGNAGFVELSPPLALLIVSLPVFAFFFLRLKKAELEQPNLKVESTKRRFSQITQIVAFSVTFISELTIVATLLAKLGGEDTALLKPILSALMFMLVWGALFAYYWFDEHKQAK